MQVGDNITPARSRCPTGTDAGRRPGRRSSSRSWPPRPAEQARRRAGRGRGRGRHRARGERPSAAEEGPTGRRPAREPAPARRRKVRGPFLVVGLGNPGPAYGGNRHNVGFMVLDLLAERVGGRFSKHKSRADVVEGRLGPLPAPRVVLAEPRSYMNESGGPVAGLCGFYKIPIEQLVVVHDELDIPYGVAAAQERRRRQRPQRAALDHPVARATGSTCGCGSASAARPAGGPGRLRAAGLLRRRAQGPRRSTSTAPPTRSRRWSATAWSRPRTATTTDSCTAESTPGGSLRETGQSAEHTVTAALWSAHSGGSSATSGLGGPIRRAVRCGSSEWVGADERRSGCVVGGRA